MRKTSFYHLKSRGRLEKKIHSHMHLGDYIFEHAAQRVTPIPKHLYLTSLSLTRPETHYFQDPVVHHKVCKVSSQEREKTCMIYY